MPRFTIWAANKCNFGKKEYSCTQNARQRNPVLFQEPFSMNQSYTTIISSTIPWKMWKNYDNRAIHVEKEENFRYLWVHADVLPCSGIGKAEDYHNKTKKKYCLRQKRIPLKTKKKYRLRQKRIPPKTKKEYRPYCHIQQHRIVLLYLQTSSNKQLQSTASPDTSP